MKNLTLIKDSVTEQEIQVTPEKVYQSNPMKSDLYSRLSAFRNSQRKFGIKDAIKDSLK